MSALDNFLAQFKQVARRDHRQLLHRRQRAQHRRLQPRLLLAPCRAASRAASRARSATRCSSSTSARTAASPSSAGPTSSTSASTRSTAGRRGARSRCASSCRRSRSLDEAGNPVGALEIQRNVTDEAVVQVKYQEMLDNEARERERLAGPDPRAHQGAARDQPDSCCERRRSCSPTRRASPSDRARRQWQPVFGSCPAAGQEFDFSDEEFGGYTRHGSCCVARA